MSENIQKAAASKLPDHARLVERHISSEQVFDGVLLDVRRDVVTLPNSEASKREWIKHPGATAVLPVFENGDVMLLNQFRYPIGQIFLEVPAGKIDPGEDPETTGLRELEEETGLRCGDYAYLGHYYPGIGYSNEVLHFYIAWNLEQLEAHADHDEFLELVRIPFTEAVERVYSGEISDGKTALCLLRGLEWWKKKGPS